MATQDKKPRSSNFSSIPQADVPQGRKGKHKDIVGRILDDLSDLRHGRALKIALDDLGDKKENVRAALNRVIHQRRLHVATSTDEEFLYVWPKNGDGAEH